MLPPPGGDVEPVDACLVLSCLLTLYTAVMSFEILFPFGLWVFFEPDRLLNHSQLSRSMPVLLAPCQSAPPRTGLTRLPPLTRPPKGREKGHKKDKAKSKTKLLTLAPWSPGSHFACERKSEPTGSTGLNK